MSLFIKDQSKTIGMVPGALVHIGDKKPEKVNISVIDYNDDHVSSELITNPDDCEKYKDAKTISWINVIGVHDTDIVQKIGDIFNLHPLVLEDIVNTDQRPKTEEYDEYIYVVVKMLTYNEKDKTIDAEQVSIIVGKYFVITFQEREGDVFDPIRKRIDNASSRARKMGADYLVHAIIDAIVDHYFLLLEKIGGDVETMEEGVTDEADAEISQNIYQLKRMLILLRKSIWPLREVVNSLGRSESKIISKLVHVYLRDVYDHTVQIIDTVEIYKDMIGGIRDTYMTVLSNRMNNIMKILTVIATIFIPLTFIAGVYGMNFKYMPELEWKIGYPIVWGIMIIVAAVMLLFFKRKKWL